MVQDAAPERLPAAPLNSRMPRLIVTPPVNEFALTRLVVAATSMTKVPVPDLTNVPEPVIDPE